MKADKVKIVHAPSQEVWYASQIGKQFEVLCEYPTHYEVLPNARNWPDDVALLVPVEDCKVTQKRKYHFSDHNQLGPPDLYIGGMRWPIPTQLELEESYPWFHG